MKQGITINIQAWVCIYTVKRTSEDQGSNPEFKPVQHQKIIKPFSASASLSLKKQKRIIYSGP